MNQKIILGIANVLLVMPLFALAATDGTYNITVDNVGFAGGEVSGDGTYQMSDTVGEPLVGIGTSEDYQTQDGFWYMVNNTLALELDANAKDFGTVSAGTPNAVSTTATVTTDAMGGYDLFISEDHSLTHTDGTTTIDDYAGTIAVPTVWSGTGFGFTVVSGTNVEAKWGTTPNNNYAGIPLSDTLFYEKFNFTSGGDDTVMEYKIDTETTQKSGDYSNTLTYTAISKL